MHFLQDTAFFTMISIHMHWFLQSLLGIKPYYKLVAVKGFLQTQTSFLATSFFWHECKGLHGFLWTTIPWVTSPWENNFHTRIIGQSLPHQFCQTKKSTHNEKHFFGLGDFANYHKYEGLVFIPLAFYHERLPWEIAMSVFAMSRTSLENNWIICRNMLQ